MVKSKYYILRVLFLFSVFFIFISFVSDKPKKIKNYGSKKLYKIVAKNYLNYNTLSIKSSIKVDFKGKKYSLKANFRIKKDSIIWLNLNHVTGMSVLRAVLTPDSIKYLDKINKKYYAGAYESTAKKLDINLSFKSFQSMLTNELISISDKRKPIKVFADYKSSVDSCMYVLNNHKKRHIKKFYKKDKYDFFLLEQVKIIPNSYKVKEFSAEDLITKKQLNIVYNNFSEIDSTLFPKNINFTVIEDTSVTSINMKYSKIRVNPKNKYSLKVPKKYEVIQ